MSPRLLRRRLALRLCSPLVALLAACGGGVDEPTPGGNPVTPGPVGEIPDGENRPFVAGEAPLRTLTPTEQEATIRSLLDLPVDVSALGAPPRVGGFDNNARARAIGPTEVDGFLRIAEAVTADVLSELDRHLPCAATSPDRACAETFVDTFGARAYRRPLDDEERAILVGLFDAELAEEGFAPAIGLVLSAMLQAPQFLHRLEAAAAQTAEEGYEWLDGYSVATRLAYMLWAGPPDEELLAAAAAGDLDSEVGVEEQARRLIEDPRFSDGLAYFHRSWLHLEGLGELTRDDPAWSPELGEAMANETVTFIDHVVREGEGTLEELLTARYTFADPAVVELYGATSDGERATLPEGERAGLLTQAAFLAYNAHPGQTSVVHRGLFVLEGLLCRPQPPAPDGLEITIPPADDTLSTRERLARHRQDPACFGCHQSIDPLGFLFEGYDWVGRYRTEQGAGVPVDSRGSVVLDGHRVELEDAVALSRALADSGEVKACYVRHWFRFALGRLETTEDARGLYEVHSSFTRKTRIDEMLVRLATSRAFRTRRVSL